MMHGHEKSDSVIVAVKPANKVAQPVAEQSAAEPAAVEPVEPRAETKGNASQLNTCRAQHRISVPQTLERIRKVTRERKKERFIALLHHIGTDMLENAFFELKKDAAPGVDGLTWKNYGQISSAISMICMTGSSVERIGRGHPGGSTYPKRTADNARSRSRRTGHNAPHAVCVGDDG
jgi:hypothetical protein